jgi:hypothetical protein
MFHEIFVVDSKPTEKAKKHIDECVSQGVCLCGCGRKATRRGLSDRCYYAFMREFSRMDEKSAKRYEGALIRKGLVLAQGMCRRIKRRISKFVAIAEEYRG